MTIEIEGDRKAQLIRRVQGFFLEEFDEEISPFRAEQVLDFAVSVVGPQIYNQAVQDARHFMQLRLDDLDGEVNQPETA